MALLKSSPVDRGDVQDTERECSESSHTIHRPLDPTIADTLGLDLDEVAVKDDLRSSGRSGVRITCRPDDELVLETLADEARRTLKIG